MKALWEAYTKKNGKNNNLVSSMLFEQLGNLLGYTSDITESYILEIWKYFKMDPPDFQVIMEAYKKLSVEHAAPSWVAYAIIVGTSSQKKADKDTEKILFPPLLDRKELETIEKTIPTSVRVKLFKSYRLQRVSVFDHERLDPNQLEHCPHGVPKRQVCCICNPEEFRRMTGIG